MDDDGDADAPPAQVAPLPEGDRPRVLWLAGRRHDYLEDTILYGFRKLLEGDVVDAPRKDVLYREHAPPPEEIHGMGFTTTRLLEDPGLDRDDVRERARRGEFDVVVWGNVHRLKDEFRAWERAGLFGEADAAQVFLDGADVIPDGAWDRAKRVAIDEFKRRVSAGYDRTYAVTPVFEPALEHGVYLKRELRADHVERHPGAAILPVAFAVPDEKVRWEVPEKEKPFVKHVQCEVAYELEEVRAGSVREAPHDSEEGYRDDISRSRYGVTMRKSGWDCMRHYEIAANLAVPCFLELDGKPYRSAPHGLVDGHNCLAFSDAAELRRKVDLVRERGLYRDLVENVRDWVRWQTSTARARQVLSWAGAWPREGDGGKGGAKGGT